MNQNKETQFIHWGKIAYQQAWDAQTDIFNKTVEIKLENRRREDAGLTPLPTPNFLIFCEHPHVYTLGKSGKENHLLLSQNQLAEKNIEYFPINRGGDITYHGDGQLVGYPIFDLDNFFTDIDKYLRFIEEAIILTLAEYGIKAGRIKGLTGVWVDFESKINPRKICAIGVKASRWVTMHGFALNINTDLQYFNYIIPCGINDKAVTSIAQELGKPINQSEVETILLQKFSEVFGLTIINKEILPTISQ